MNKQGQTQARAGEQGPCEEKALGSKQWEMGRGAEAEGIFEAQGSCGGLWVPRGAEGPTGAPLCPLPGQGWHPLLSEG